MHVVPGWHLNHLPILGVVSLIWHLWDCKRAGAGQHVFGDSWLIFADSFTSKMLPCLGDALQLGDVIFGSWLLISTHLLLYSGHLHPGLIPGEFHRKEFEDFPLYRSLGACQNWETSFLWSCCLFSSQTELKTGRTVHSSFGSEFIHLWSSSWLKILCSWLVSPVGACPFIGQLDACCFGRIYGRFSSLEFIVRIWIVRM